jgi:hypothetical protein
MIEQHESGIYIVFFERNACVELCVAGVAPESTYFPFRQGHLDPRTSAFDWSNFLAAVPRNPLEDITDLRSKNIEYHG